MIRRFVAAATIVLFGVVAIELVVVYRLLRTTVALMAGACP